MSIDHMELRLAAAREMPKQIINTRNLIALLNDYDALLAAGQPKRKAAAKKAAAAPVGTLPGWLPLELWEAFLAMRVKIKKPATEYAQKLLIKKLDNFRTHGLDITEILEQSITNGWQDLYAPKNPMQRGFGYDPAPAGTALPLLRNQQSMDDTRRAASEEAKRRLRGGGPGDDGMTFEMETR